MVGAGGPAGVGGIGQLDEAGGVGVAEVFFGRVFEDAGPALSGAVGCDFAGALANDELFGDVLAGDIEVDGVAAWLFGLYFPGDFVAADDVDGADNDAGAGQVGDVDTVQVGSSRSSQAHREDGGFTGPEGALLVVSGQVEEDHDDQGCHDRQGRQRQEKQVYAAEKEPGLGFEGDGQFILEELEGEHVGLDLVAGAGDGFLVGGVLVEQHEEDTEHSGYECQ